MDAPVNLARVAAALPDLWSPRVVARVGDQLLKVGRVHGEFVWHDHAAEDELFLVLGGELTIEIEGRASVTLRAGEAFVVPAGVRHRPVAAEECLMALFEPAATTHTGAEMTPLTRTIDEQMRAVGA